MRKTIKNLLEHNATLIAIIATAIIAFLSLKTINFESPIDITFFDKILHFSAYFALTLTWFFSQRLKKNTYIILIAIFLYGVLLEYFQAWFAPNRTKDFYDVLANSLGIIFAALLFKPLYKYYNKIFGIYN